MFRCESEITTWKNEVLSLVEKVEEELVKEAVKVHSDAEVGIFVLLGQKNTQEEVVEHENGIIQHGSTTMCKTDFKAFSLAISPLLETLLFSGERLASLTDSPLLPSQLSLQLVALSSEVRSKSEGVKKKLNKQSG